MQDLNELTEQLDLDAALERTHARHRELVHRSAVRRRWAAGGACAVVLIAAAAILPQLGADDSTTSVRFAGPGDSSSTEPVANRDAGGATSDTSSPKPPPVVAPPDFALSHDGDVVVLTRDPSTLPELPMEGNIGSAIVEERAAGISGVHVTADPTVVQVDFFCVGMGDQITEVRYRQEPARLVVDATIEGGRPGPVCELGGRGSSIELTLDAPFMSGSEVVAQRL